MKVYKTSKYNYFIDYQEKKLLFNGMTGAAFCMKMSEYETLIPLLENTTTFQEKYPSDAERLHKLGYLIDSDFDEVLYMKLKNREATFLDKSYRLTLNPTLECNFNCWYCYEAHPKGFMTKKTIARIKRHIKYMIEVERITSLRLDWFGGEPLLYFDEVMVPIARYAQTLCKKSKIPYASQITTNAYCISDKMIQDFKELNFVFFQITIDGDRERHNKIRNASGKPSFDIIMRNINALAQALENVSITMRINYDEVTLKSNAIFSVLDMIQEENRKKVNVNLQRVWQTHEKRLQQGQTTNHEMQAIIEAAKEKGFIMASSGGGLSIGMHYTCYVSRYYHTEINYDETIYKCTARTYKPEYEMGKLLENGQIAWNQKKLSLIYANPLFENEVCLKCKYLPICNGPCPQKVLDAIAVGSTTLCSQHLREQPFESDIVQHYEFSNKNRERAMLEEKSEENKVEVSPL